MCWEGAASSKALTLASPMKRRKCQCLLILLSEPSVSIAFSVECRVSELSLWKWVKLDREWGMIPKLSRRILDSFMKKSPLVVHSLFFIVQFHVPVRYFSLLDCCMHVSWCCGNGTFMAISRGETGLPFETRSPWPFVSIRVPTAAADTNAEICRMVLTTRTFTSSQSCHFIRENWWRSVKEVSSGKDICEIHIFVSCRAFCMAQLTTTEGGLRVSHGGPRFSHFWYWKI